MKTIELKLFSNIILSTTLIGILDRCSESTLRANNQEYPVKNFVKRKYSFTVFFHAFHILHYVIQLILFITNIIYYNKFYNF